MLVCIVDKQNYHRVTDTQKILHDVDAGFGETSNEAVTNYLKHLEEYVSKVIKASLVPRIQDATTIEHIPFEVSEFGGGR